MDAIVLAGDGRHNSKGLSAKYCSHSIFCVSEPFFLIQRNEAGSSLAMEYMAFTRSMEDMADNLNMTTFVSDRHFSIAEHNIHAVIHTIHVIHTLYMLYTLYTHYTHTIHTLSTNCKSSFPT